MTNFILARPNESDSETLTSSGATIASGLPLTNLLKTQPTDVARYTDTTNAATNLIVDMGDTGERSLFGLLWTNMSKVTDPFVATVRLRGSTSSGGTTTNTSYDSGFIREMSSANLGSDDGRHHWVHHIGSTGKKLRWWRFDIGDASNPDGFIDIGRLYISKPYIPAVNIDFGWSIRRNDPSPIERGIGGQAYPLERPTWRVLNISLRAQSEDEMWDNIFEIERERGSAKDVFALIDFESTKHNQRWAVHGLMTNMRPIINQRTSLYEHRIQIEEML